MEPAGERAADRGGEAPMSAHPSDIAQYSLPADPEKNRFRYIIVAADRARQIFRGAHPIIPTGSRKPARIAMIECRLGLIAFRTEK